MSDVQLVKLLIEWVSKRKKRIEQGNEANSDCAKKTGLPVKASNFKDPAVRINAAKALKDNEANRECAKKTGLPDGWLALKKDSFYAIRAPNGDCYSTINSLPQDISKAALSFINKQKNANKSAELIAAQEREFNRTLRRMAAEKKFASTKVKADNRDVDSMIDLAKMYLFGEGTTKDEREAFYWFDKASDYSNIAIAWVADCYLLGLGVEKDFDEGCDYLFDSASEDEGESNMF